MEIILAIVVASAVIFFGALISMGNERQRKAIDGLREQVVLWAVQDLKIKRETLVHEARVDDPVLWLNQVASKACGEDLDLTVVEAFDNPQTLACIAKDGRNVLFSIVSPTYLRKIKTTHKNTTSRLATHHPLLHKNNKTIDICISALNSSIMFDLELPLAWFSLSKMNIQEKSCLWMYLIKNNNSSKI